MVAMSRASVEMLPQVDLVQKSRLAQVARRASAAAPLSASVVAFLCGAALGVLPRQALASCDVGSRFSAASKEQLWLPS